MSGYFVGPMPIERFLADFVSASSSDNCETALEEVFRPMETVAQETLQTRQRGVKKLKKPQGTRKPQGAKNIIGGKKMQPGSKLRVGTKSYGKKRAVFDDSNDDLDDDERARKEAVRKQKVNLQRARSEKAMYPVFLQCIQDTCLCPDLRLVDTSSKPDKTDKTQVKPDVSVYSSTLDPLPNTTCWKDVELCIEIKGTVDQDPFYDGEYEGITAASYGQFSTSPTPKRHNVQNLRLAESFSQGSGILIPYMLERNTVDAIKNRGQLFDYARLQWERQERAFFFQIIIFQDFARILRYDRAGVIVSARFQYQKTPYLAQFLSRFNSLSNSQRGKDTTVSVPTPDEIEQAKTILGTSIDDGRPMLKVAISDQDTQSVKYVITSKLISRSPSIMSRATRCYVAADLANGKRVLLKDAWRYDHDDIRKEGYTYRFLQSKGVRNIAKVVYHGDVCGLGQRTVTRRYSTSDWSLRTRTLNVHQHYRMVLDVIGTPILEAPSSRIIVKAILGALIAHWDAYHKAGILHRDLSPGNILYHEKTQEGILIDWDLCRETESLQREGARLRARTGTWQFISYDILLQPKKTHTLQDDLQSAFWILLWLCLHSIPNNLPKLGVLRSTTEEIFDRSAWCEATRCCTGGDEKSKVIEKGAYIVEGVLDKPAIRFDVAPLDNLVRATWELFRAFAWCKVVPVEGMKVDAAKLNDSEEIIRLFEEAVASPEWPEHDRKDDLLVKDQKAIEAPIIAQIMDHDEKRLKRLRKHESQTPAKSRRDSFAGDAASASRSRDDVEDGLMLEDEDDDGDWTSDD